MLSGLHQQPTIPLEVVRLVQFWRSGFEAYRTHMTYAVETQKSDSRLCTIYSSQKGILTHLSQQVAAFADNGKGWKAHPLFKRRHGLSSDEQTVVSTFRDSVLLREWNALRKRLSFIQDEHDIERLATHLRREFNFFPSFEHIFRNLANRHSLDASKRKISIINFVTDSQQFNNPRIHTQAVALFDSILQDVVVQSKRAKPIEITTSGLMISFSYAGRNPHPVIKPHIQKQADDLGWRTKISLSQRGMTQLTIAMTKACFASSGTMAKRKRTTQRLKTLKMMSYEDMIRLAGLFANVQLWQGFRLSGGKLVVSETPTFQLIESVRMLIEPIAHNLAESISEPSL